MKLSHMYFEPMIAKSCLTDELSSLLSAIPPKIPAHSFEWANELVDSKHRSDWRLSFLGTKNGRHYSRSRQFLVHWEGYSHTEDSWVKEKDIDAEMGRVYYEELEK